MYRRTQSDFFHTSQNDSVSPAGVRYHPYILSYRAEDAVSYRMSEKIPCGPVYTRGKPATAQECRQLLDTMHNTFCK